MLQQEFESLYGKKVSEAEYEIINGLYMLDENTDKKQFVDKYKGMTKEELMNAFVILNLQSKKHTDSLTKAMHDAEKKASEAERELGKERESSAKTRQELAELQQKHHDFATIAAVETHQYDRTATIAACIETLGLAGYYKALLHAGCTLTQDDLKFFVETLEEIEDK